MKWTYEFPKESGFYGVTYNNEDYYIIHVTKISNNEILVKIIGDNNCAIEYKNTVKDVKWYGPIELPNPNF